MSGGPMDEDDTGMPTWLSATSYWQPQHYPESAWITHAPFAFWLVDVLRPTTVVELGTHNGYSCFVFAEALRRLRLTGTVNALDSWEGDEHMGAYGESVYERFMPVVRSEYPDLVKPLRGYFATSRPQFREATADLLHIDGRHGYDDVLEDYTLWRPTVREGGMILFHDTAERKAGFGVWRLWEQLVAENPTRSFSFEHGHGLGVLAIGEVSDPRLRALFEADDETISRVRADYEKLGDEVQRRADNDQAQADLAALVETLSWRITRPLRRMKSRVRPGP
ncbi:class I SAM-dependent methyltransferase [Microbacterium lacus]|uniref:class I SAM-dependent methyltransferase n=1 Tax=Microbacterium lacus TaxID=415217 RepID=UPI00384B122C